MISRHSLGSAQKVCKLGDLVDFLDHKRRPVRESDRRAGEYPYYGANGIQGTIDGFIFNEPLVLLAEDGGHFENPRRGIAYRISGKSWVNNHAHVLRPKSTIDINYLYRVLENYDVTPWITGTTRAKLTKAGASEIEIPLPSLADQRLIASVLDKADSLRAMRNEAIAKIDQLLKSAFRTMFGDPTANPKGWPEAQLGNLGKVQTGATPPTSEEGMFDGLVPFVTPGDLGGSIFLSRRSLTAAGAKKSRIAPAGSVLVCCIGTIGKMGYAVQDCAFNQQINAVTWGSRVNVKYGYYALRLFAGELAHQGSSTTLPILRKSAFEQLAFPVPPIALQRDFERIALVVEHQKKLMLLSLDKLESLFLALQRKCFSGAVSHAR